MEEKQSVVTESERLTIIYWDDPRLSQICDKIEDNEFGPKLESFGRQLIATMESKDGIGLAAPQVGITKRMFVMHLPDNAPDSGLVDATPLVVCNPVLKLEGAAKQDREGCLSLPGIFDHVVRAERATLQYQDALGKSFELSLSNLNARVAQHEFDHLNGIMFFDYKDKRDVYGARMSKQVGKNVLRMWEKEKKKRGY